MLNYLHLKMTLFKSKHVNYSLQAEKLELIGKIDEWSENSTTTKALEYEYKDQTQTKQ